MKQLKSRQKLTKKSAKSGFTLVELSITMAFLAMLLISIAIVITNLITIYQKGLTVKAINSVGRSLTDNFIASINSAPSVDTTSLCESLVSGSANQATCKDDHANLFVFQATQDSRTGNQYNGVFCTGKYSYLWNTYYAESSAGNKLNLRYRDSSGHNHDIYAPRLIRIEDPTHRVCSAATDGYYNSNLSSSMTIDITTLAHKGAGNIENRIAPPESGFLTEFDLDLALYELTIFPISQDSVTLRTYMNGTFILATLRGNIDIQRTGDYCSTGGTTADGSQDTSNINDIGSEFNYCAINKFNFAARTAGV